MAYDGNGNFNRLYSWVSDRDAAIPIDAPKMDGEMDGFATGLSTCITKDGQTTITANIPMNSNKFTGLAAGTGTGDSARYGQTITSASFNTGTGVITFTRSDGNITVDIDGKYQDSDAGLTSIAGLTTSANQMIYTTASDTYATTSLTAAGRAILDDASASAQRTTLGVAIGSDVQAYDAGLTSIAGLTTLADRMIYTTASDTYAVATLTSAGRALIDDASASAQRTTLELGTAAIVDTGTGTSDVPTTSQADARYCLESNNLSDLTNASTGRTNLGVAIGSDVQAYDAGLTSIAGLTTAADRMIYTTAADTYAVATLTSAGRALLDDASNSAQRTTLGLGTAAIVNTGTGTGDVPTTSQADARYLLESNNLSDLTNAATARTNLSVQSTTDADARYCLESNNLSDVTNAATARSNLGAGTMSSFNATGDSGGNAQIDDGETLTIAGGTNISTARSGNTVTVNVEPPTVSNYTKASAMYLYEPRSASAVSFSLSGNLTESTSETIGPTGSGATNIVSGLPSGASAYYLYVRGEGDTAAAGNITLEVRAAKNGITAGAAHRVLYHHYHGENVGDDFGASNNVWVPCDGNGVISMLWTGTNLTSESVSFELLGYAV